MILIRLPEHRFAFYDKQTTKFNNFSGSQSWENFSQFQLDFIAEVNCGRYKFPSDLDLYRNLLDESML